jgi:hypothetical protein
MHIGTTGVGATVVVVHLSTLVVEAALEAKSVADPQAL